MGMGNLAGAGDSPAVGMVVGLADWADLDPARVIGLDRVQAVGADVLFSPDEFDFLEGFFLRSGPLNPGRLFGLR